MTYWFGVVEDRDDSSATDGLKLGRVRVRIYGHHSSAKIEDNISGEGIPTEDLFWAYPIMPINSASMNGIGESPTGIVEGTNVIGISRDGDAMQDLIILGTVGGISKSLPDTSSGFNDPNGIYPKSDFLNEPDVNRLARVDDITNTVVQKKKESRLTSVPIALGGTWDEPWNPYAAVYPFNHVKETESGHIVEFDDTPGQERTHSYHRTGTFTEIDKEGTKVEKIVKDNYTIILGNDHISVTGNCHIHIGGDATLDVDGNCKIKIDGDLTTNTTGNVLHTVGGNMTTNVGGNITENASAIHHNA